MSLLRTSNLNDHEKTSIIPLNFSTSRTSYPTAFSLTSRSWSKRKKSWSSKPRCNVKSSNKAKITLAIPQNLNLTLPKTFPLHIQCRISRNLLHPLIRQHIMPHLHPQTTLQQLTLILDSLSNNKMNNPLVFFGDKKREMKRRHDTR